MNQRPSRIGFAFALLASVIAGLMAGVAVGAPGLVERAATRGLAAVEKRFGVALDAATVDWTWSGGISASSVTVRGVNGELIGTIEKIDIAADVDLAARSLTLRSLDLHDVVIAIEQRADGTLNIDGVLKGIGLGAGSSPPAAIPGGRFLKVVAPTVNVDGLRVVARRLPGLLLDGFGLPRVVGFSGGTFRASPVGEVDEALGLRGATFEVALAFADTTLDPGHGFRISFRGGASIGPERIAIDFARPLRLPFGARLVALGGLGWERQADALVVRDLQLSQPLGADDTVEVAAAISLPQLRLSPLGVAATLDAARTGSGGLAARLRTALAEIRHVAIERPVIAFARAADGSHSFEDVVTQLAALGGLAVPGEKSPGPIADTASGFDTLALSFDASRRALDLLGLETTPPVNSKLADGLRSIFERMDSLMARLLGRVEDITTIVPGARPWPLVEVRGGRVLLDMAGENVAIDGIEVGLSSATSGRAVRVSAMLSGAYGSPGRLQLQLSPPTLGANDEVSPVLSLRIENIATRLIAPFSRSVAALLPSDTDAVITKLDVDMTPVPGVRGEPLGWEVAGRLVFAGVDVAFPALSDATLKNLDGDISARVSFHPARRIFQVSDLIMSRGDVTVRGALDVADPQGVPKIRLDLMLPEVDVQRVFDAIPPEVVPMLAGLRLRGLLGWKLVVDFDTAAPAALRIDSRPNLAGFAVEGMGDVIDFSRLHGSHAYRILLSDGTEGTRLVGPATGSWVPLHAISPWLPLALTTTEDGTFHTNDGISTLAIRESIIANLERGAFVRGGSTITQQLVKNLYLGGTKKIGRKLQELFIAWRLSQTMSKDDVMALYLNTIEFGPGIYGIGDAAYHWFGKRAIDLDLTECIFLASIIPSPRKYHSFFEAGAITPRWAAYLEMLLRVMVKRAKITEEDLAAAIPLNPRFRGSGAGTGAADVFDVLPDRETPNGNGDTPVDEDAWDGDLLDGQ